jgi:hypothetical protein
MRASFQDHPPQHRKWLLVHDHKQALALFRSFRFWRWFAVAWLPAAGAVGYRAWTDFAATPVFGGGFMSLGVTAILVQSLMRRMVISNVGVFLRESEPVRFWLSNILLAFLYCFVVVGILRA